VAGKNYYGLSDGDITLVSERILKLLAFDAAEPGNDDQHRKNYGNNAYMLSNIRQWMNAVFCGSR
jgi:hypothetical protein